MEKKLEPENAEFLDKVRYILTSEERKIFLELPDSEKENFKEEFWKRRDPTPATEENEFRMEYFDRIERSNELFVSEAIPGWLSDRGRIYILFGPPSFRETHPMGSADYSILYGRCGEVWYYGIFPMVFIDQTCTGIYRLVTYDLSSIRYLNLMYMHEINLAQAQAQQTILGERRFFDFDWNVKKTLVEEDKVEGMIHIDVPYANLWFKEEENKLKTTLDIHLELKNEKGIIVWKKNESFKVETDEEKLKVNKRKRFKIEIPFVLEKNVNKLRKGKNRIFVTLRNRTGGDEMKKVMDFNI